MLGLIHGMAGSAALVVLVVDKIDSMWMGMIYEVLFGRNQGRLHNGLQLSIGGLTCCFGLFVLSTWI